MSQQTGISIKILKILPLVILVAGCVSTPTPPIPTSANSQASSPTAAQTSVASAALSTASIPAHFSSTPLILVITSPTDQAVVSQPSVEVRGTVSTEAVLTINNDIYILTAGAFTETVALDDGPNAIQIAASNMSGTEVDKILTVTYQP